jgi:hypothetical protein
LLQRHAHELLSLRRKLGAQLGHFVIHGNLLPPVAGHGKGQSFAVSQASV